MRRPIWSAISLALLGVALTATAALAAGVIPVYSNDMATAGARAQLIPVGGGKCNRGGSGGALKLTVGKATRQCQLRTPVIGANLDLSATARLGQGTPAALQGRVFVAIGVRDGDGGRYQLAVFPKKGSFQLRRDVPPNGDETLLAKGKAPSVKGVGQPNKLRLQVFSSPDGTTRVTAYVNGRKLASVLDDAQTAARLTGRYSTLAVGSTQAAKGAAGTFDDLTVSVPDPF